MKVTAKIYTLATLLTICLGLLSRKIEDIPLAAGDVLYAVMMYSIMRLLFTKKSLLFALTLAIFICFSIEFLQLVQHPNLIWARNHPLLRLVLGQGFLISDLLAYIAGGIIGFSTDYALLKQAKRR